MAKLKEDIAKLPKWPKFADLFDFHQYDGLNLEVVKTMVSAVSAKKEHVFLKVFDFFFFKFNFIYSYLLLSSGFRKGEGRCRRASEKDC